ncbi:filamentous haemagglutinin family protein [Pseudomonas huanghezhanensis]|uniref:filamentous haemagglutinin family protein n=1 Tax=Pseudomonas huanghezhanensis TaxID=3002903 RepID=UPI0022869FEE|nr:filamentous haemagglutinin family protein [Pseudomonas sp. BSw22131]
MPSYSQPGLWRLKPLVQAMALLLVAGTAQAAQPFSGAWFTAKGANTANAGRAGAAGGTASGYVPPLAQQQRADAQLQRSLLNLNNTVAAIAAQQAAQAAGRQAALATVQAVPDGLGEGGLKVDTRLTQGWLNAQAPTQSTADGKTTVSVKQTADKAILNWETFNVGRNTTVAFDQGSDWAVLNRINDPTARPSQIQGQITGNGTVMLVNRNGIVFSGSSQVNVRNLVAAAATITDGQFTSGGLYVNSNGTLPTFTDAAGAVLVQQGAQLDTLAPGTSTGGGGYVLLLGSQVDNAGSISTPKGQATLAAGDDFYIRRGVSTNGNASSTTRGNEVSARRSAASAAGTVTNSGTIMASTGDITLTGHQVTQAGVAVASTSTDIRGTVHLLNAASDSTGSVTLGSNATTAVLLDSASGSALDSQRLAGYSGLTGVNNLLASGQFNNLSTVADRTDLSRVEIVSGGTVDFQGGSTTLATGGQIAVSAGQRSLVRDGATLDVSGAIGVQLAMSSNSILVNIQGNELRDASGNRDAGKLSSNDVWVDTRDLVYVPAGTNGYATDRWYTAGGLLEVSGYLGTQTHSVGEWMAQGGTLTFTGNDVVTQAGSVLNLAGGTLDVEGGYIQQTWLTTASGRLYEVSSAPGDILYTGIYKGFEDASARWGQVEYFYNPLIAPRQRYEQGYTVGRDAGSLVIGTRNAVLEGQVIADVYQGVQQTTSANAALDGYQQAQTAVARRGQLLVGNYTPIFSNGVLKRVLSPMLDQVVIGNGSSFAESIDLLMPVSSDRTGSLMLNAQALSDAQLGGLQVAAGKNITVQSALSLGDGGSLTLYAPQVDVLGNLVAHGGQLRLGNVLSQYVLDRSAVEDVPLLAARGTAARVSIGEGVQVEATGRWSNLALDSAGSYLLASRDGGSVSMRSSGDVRLGAGSLVDVSSGATLLANGTLRGGKGGDLQLSAATQTGLNAAVGDLTLGGELRGVGVSGGGTLSLASREVSIGAANITPGVLNLASGFFAKGFGAYAITGALGLEVADGAQVSVTRPVYQLKDTGSTLVTGNAPTDALQVWLPDLYQTDPVNAVLSQRGGASLALSAGNINSLTSEIAGTALQVGAGAVVSVDPGASIELRSTGQLTLDGALNAWGGSVTLGAVTQRTAITQNVVAAGSGRSIWLGDQAVIDVSARAATAIDNLGRTYGQVGGGGSIVIGGVLDTAAGTASAADVFVVLREGAQLKADGAQASLYVTGQGQTLVASDGGSLSLASNNGLYLDGNFSARSGGAGAPGGKLDIALWTAEYYKADGKATDRPLMLRDLVVSQRKDSVALAESPEAAADTLQYGHAALSAASVASGGFDNLNLMSSGIISFTDDLSLQLGQSLSLSAAAFTLADSASARSQVKLSAPYVLLSSVLPSKLLLDGLAFHTDLYDATTSFRGSEATFSVQANLLDIAKKVLFSAAGSLKNLEGTVAFDRAGFEQVSLTSQGDLRFLGGASLTGESIGTTTVLRTPQALALNGAQIYPGTGAQARIDVGYIRGTSDYDPLYGLTISRTTPDIPAMPYAALGGLTFYAGSIEQGGVVRAPLGQITLGTSGTQRLQLLAGSITSVSGAGLLMPYGGTADGQTYLYDGTDITGAAYSQAAVRNPGITLAGTSVDVASGATLDLSGGGELTGASFISGRGGSTDARLAPLMQVNVDGSFTLPSLTSHPVYALVPGVQAGYAPVAADAGAGDPLIGQQITLAAGVPGLPAGTYTLLPSTYALLSGAFRVELSSNTLAASTGAQPLRNGSWSAAGQVSVANTALRDSLAQRVTLTPAATLRTYSQYNETGYSNFLAANAAKLGTTLGVMPADAKNLTLELNVGSSGTTPIGFHFAGTGLFAAASGGSAGTATVTGGAAIQVLANTQSEVGNFNGVSVEADSLNALNAGALIIGDSGALYDVILRSGATLRAPAVVLRTGTGNITVEQGAAINTLGQGTAPTGSQFINLAGTGNVLALSNGSLNLVSPGSSTGGGIYVGLCPASSGCSGDTRLYSEGSLVASTGNTFELDSSARYGTRHLTLALSNINIGSTAALDAGGNQNTVPSGLTLDPAMLQRLLRGDVSAGAPALESLQFSAGQALNFYGSAQLDTYDSVTGASLLSQLVLTAPAIYGSGSATDQASIHTAELVWNGSATAAPAVISGGAGTGSGQLNVSAERIVFGAADAPSSNTSLGRSVLGFATVNLAASQVITSNAAGSLSVHQSQGGYVTGSGFSYSGGDLNISTPLLTAAAGSVNRISAGGQLRVIGLPAKEASVAGEGGNLTLQADSISLDTTVVLPSGRLTLNARGDLTLGDGAQIDLSGRRLVFNDLTKYSWGGDVVLSSREGNIRQSAGSTLNVSAVNNQAGSISATALGAGAGIVDLQGSLLGSSSGTYDAGGTLVPYASGVLTLRAQQLGIGDLSQAFDALNQRLNAGQVLGSRSFQIKQGDLVIANDLKASDISVSLDGGSLRVSGTIDASGAEVGSIALSAANGLTIDGSAVLDAHGRLVRVDSRGQIIASPNRAMIELNAGAGLLTLGSGTRMDLRYGTDTSAAPAMALGTVELYAPRLGSATSGDMAIDASGALTIQGARSIAVNGTWRYTDAPYAPDLSADGRAYQWIDQAYLNGKHLDSQAFINAALGNGNLLGTQLAGLYNPTYASVLHLRPAVEIASATADGDLVVRGDVDLSGYRYASLNPASAQTSVYGSGEAGQLTLRAGGNLSVYGSISDGFAPPPATQDDNGWVLLAGLDYNGGDTVVPAAGVTLADGTTIPGGRTLNYDLPIKAITLSSGTRLPVAATLSADLLVPAGTVLSAAVRDSAGGLLYATGTLLSTATTLPAGTQLDAGSVLSGNAALNALVWPKGVILPTVADAVSASQNLLTLNGDLPLASGSMILSGTNVILPGAAASVALRPEVSGRQGALWAAAPMLAQGSQSWSLRLVAGADLTAADSRLVSPTATHGTLNLADSHYGTFGVITTAYILNQFGADNGLGAVGDTVTQSVSDSFGYSSIAQFCADLGACEVSGSYTVNQFGADNGLGAVGDTVTESIAADFGYASISQFCADLGACDFSGTISYAYEPGGTRPSVVRTGTGDLELMSAADLRMDSLFGVYTAGTSVVPTTATDAYNLPRALASGGLVLSGNNQSYESLVDGGSASVYRAWYPDYGGNLTLGVGGDLSGATMNVGIAGGNRPDSNDAGYDSTNVGNWLWRQGSGEVLGGSAAQAGAWWINYGTYVPGITGTPTKSDTFVGFTGFGTLGGGDLHVSVAGDAGTLAQMAGNAVSPYINPRSQALVLAVGSTGRVAADGSVTVTGGGDLTLSVAGSINPFSTTVGTDQTLLATESGVVTDLRGHLQVDAQQIGSMAALTPSIFNTATKLTVYLPQNNPRVSATGGLTLVPGDSTAGVNTLGDLVLSTVGDAGRATPVAGSPTTLGDGTSGYSWFSLWTARTAVDLFSAGGNLSPVNDQSPTDLAVVYPTTLRAIAANGSIFYGYSAQANPQPATALYPLELAPSATGELQLLAGDSIYGLGMGITQSGAAASSLATPQNPAYLAGSVDSGSFPLGNVSSDASTVYIGRGALPLIAFGADGASNDWGTKLAPSRFYARSGDLFGVSSGSTLNYTGNDLRTGEVVYIAGRPVWMMAGRDILRSGSLLASSDVNPGNEFGLYSRTNNLFVNSSPTDVSIVTAGRDIIYSSFNIAGPGTLEITAGRNLLMEDQASITSIGPVATGDSRPGASIALLAGVGSPGANYGTLLSDYLTPANLAVSGTPLASQPGKVAKTYYAELQAWLLQRYGFRGSESGALSYFAQLPAEQQRIFARTIYFAELTAAGREYNQVGGVRQGSYLRGRNAIAALFPTKDVAGNTLMYNGDISLYGAAGVHTNLGGGIQMLTPGGGQVFGIEGSTPPASAGIITQGEGDIQLYSQDSILLGQSRIMTTFGGSILAWSAEGDINAGRGSKTTVVYTPPRRIYDNFGNVTLSPTVPTTGAGIATLNPIPEVPAGDIDLIAPLGTVDAGEAGIRVSGNVNIAALQVVNAANIQVQGASQGVPVVAAVNTNAISAASAAAASATDAAENLTRQQQNAARKNEPSVFAVKVLSFGSEPLVPGQDGASLIPAQRGYDSSSPVQVLGAGQLDERARQRLTPQERDQLTL